MMAAHSQIHTDPIIVHAPYVVPTVVRHHQFLLVCRPTILSWLLPGFTCPSCFLSHAGTKTRTPTQATPLPVESPWTESAGESGRGWWQQGWLSWVANGRRRRPGGCTCKPVREQFVNLAWHAVTAAKNATSAHSLPPSQCSYTVDELGREAFITNNPLQMLRKASDCASWRGLAAAARAAKCAGLSCSTSYMHLVLPSIDTHMHLPPPPSGPHPALHCNLCAQTYSTTQLPAVLPSPPPSGPHPSPHCRLL